MFLWISDPWGALDGDNRKALLHLVVRIVMVTKLFTRLTSTPCSPMKRHLHFKGTNSFKILL